MEDLKTFLVIAIEINALLSPGGISAMRLKERSRLLCRLTLPKRSAGT